MGYGFRTSIDMNQFRMIKESFTTENVLTGMITSILGCTGPALLILGGAANGHLTTLQLDSWMFAIYVFGGLFSIIFPILYKMPITGAHSISTAAFLTTAMAYYPFSEFVGAYILSGIVIFILGVTGIFNRILPLIPKEIISAMLAGMVANYVVKLVPAVLHMPIVGGLAMLGFVLAPKVSKKIPAVIGSLVFSSLAVLIFYPISLRHQNLVYVAPHLQTPTFSWTDFLSISLPIVLLILSNDAAQGIGALKSLGYDPPTSRIISFSGLATIITGIFGGHCANIGGMMTALCAGEDAGPRDKRYIASVVSGIGLVIFGLSSSFTVGIIRILPADFITMTGGFALIGVLISSLQIGFSQPVYRFSPLFAFVIALSNVNFLNISAPVWSLLIGVLLAKVMGEGEKPAQHVYGNQQKGIYSTNGKV